MSKPTIEVTPEEIVAGSFVTVSLIVDGDDDLGDINFNLDAPTISSVVELGSARKAQFYTQNDGPHAVSFTDAAGKVLASKDL